MTKSTVAIIGVGPRGLSILERAAALAERLPRNAFVEIHLVDPGEWGQGTHDARQPHHLITNTLSAQVTMFPPDTAAGGPDGVSFAQWARRQGYRRFNSAYYPVGDDSGAEVGDQDYLPRQLLGEYLTWVYDQVAATLPPNVTLVHHRRRAVDIQKVEDCNYLVTLDNGFIIDCNFVLLTTGHGRRQLTAEDEENTAFSRDYATVNSRLRYFQHAYPVDRLATIAPGATVAVEGLGLTAHDVISELTVGRGGRFTGAGASLRYHKSGREPKILMLSRSGLPFSVRGINQKGVAGRYEPNFFTLDAIRALRRQRQAADQGAKLDFYQELYPLLLRDMGYVHRVALTGHAIDPRDYEFTEEERIAVERILKPLDGRQFDDFASFRSFFRNYMVTDLAEAEKGNVSSPAKAVTDVLRDTRESMRLAAEYGGLTPESHRRFISEFVPLINRCTFGPPQHRHHEFLALWDAGILDLGGGPGCRVRPDPQTGRFAIETRFTETVERKFADVLVVARIDVFSPETDSAPLTRNLLARGLIRPYRNAGFHPGGIDIDERNHVVNADGEREAGFWAIGYPVEGPHFYTQELPRALKYSRLTRDAETCIDGLFTAIADQAAAASSARREREAERQPVAVT